MFLEAHGTHEMIESCAKRFSSTRKLHRLYQLTCLLGALLCFAGCAPMSESDCQTVNWSQRGIDDGTRGYSRDSYLQYTQDCQQYSVSVNAEDYLAGWDSGIQNYCSRDNGWKVGNNGGTYSKNCPSEIEAEFYSAYQLGRNVSQRKAESQNIQNELNEVRDDLSRENLSDDKRKRLKREKKRLKDELEEAQAESYKAVSEARRMGFEVY